MSESRTAYSTRRPGLWAVAAAIVATTALGAQAPPDIEAIYVIQGAQRDAQAEALLQADSAGGARSLRVYRVGASLERLFQLYAKRLIARPYGDPDSVHAPVIPQAPVTGSTPVFYHLMFHSFDDECMDAVPVAGTECRRWRRGKDKRKVLEDSRIGYEQGRWPKWIDTVTFTWLRREPNGDVVRFRVELRDIGLSPDWKRHIPLARLLVEGVVLPPGTP